MWKKSGSFGSVRNGAQCRFRKKLESAGAVRKSRSVSRLPTMLFLSGHFAKSLFVSFWQKDRIITKAEFAAWWPDQRPFHFATIILRFSIGPCQADDRDKARFSLLWPGYAVFLQKRFDLLHSRMEVARTISLVGPIGSINTRCAVKRINHNAGIIRQ